MGLRLMTPNGVLSFSTGACWTLRQLLRILALMLVHESWWFLPGPFGHRGDRAAGEDACAPLGDCTALDSVLCVAFPEPCGSGCSTHGTIRGVWCGLLNESTRMPLADDVFKRSDSTL